MTMTARIALLAIVLTGLWMAEGFSREVEILTAHAQDRRTAWAVMREGFTAITEVWVAVPDGAPRRVRTFPGRPEGMAWEGDRLIYADRGLRLPLVKGQADEAEAVIAPGQAWAVGLTGEEDAPVKEEQEKEERGKRKEKREKEQGNDSPFLLSPFSFPLAGEGGGAEVQRAVDAMWEGLNLVMTAYGAAQTGDFKGASASYERAASWFEKMPAEVRKVGMSRAVFRRYAEALRLRAKADGQAMGRGVCADHLKAIGGFLKRYVATHGGQFPENLEALKAWLDQQHIPAWVVFRSPVDADSGQIISYGYRMPQGGDKDGTPVVWSYYYTGRGVELLRSGDRLMVIDRPLGKAQVDSLFAVGLRSLESDSPAVAVRALKAVIYVAPAWGPGHTRLGYAYLKAGQIDRAEAVFQKAIEVDRGVAEAHNGLGMVFTKHPLMLQWAIEEFQKALRWNPQYAEARYHIAEIRLKLKQYDALTEAERVIGLDPNYAPAYRLIGEGYEIMEDDYQNAALWYLRYLSFKPDDSDARLRLGKAYLKTGDFEGTTKVLMDYVQQHPKEGVHVLPVLAQACFEMKRLDWSLTFFKRYLDQIDPAERALYEDIRPLASPEEIAEYEAALKMGQREVFLRRFWAKRDPDLSTTVNERLLEHYRRVSYARLYFSKGKQPWDRRGEVYIRFGEPDYRSRSDEVNFRQNMAVQRVRERMTGDIYGEKAQVLSTNEFSPVWPVGQSPWESWVYTKVGDGFEVTFTDELMGGAYDFAPLPHMNTGPERRGYAPLRPMTRPINMLLWYWPQRVVERFSALMPDYYVPKDDAPPLKFYYDLADFRGTQEGCSTLEVYYGIPQVIGRYLPEQDSTRMIVERQAALLNLETGAIYRTQGELVFQSSGDLTRQPGAFVPDVVRLEVPPGTYRLEVTATDRQSGRTGTYRQDVGIVPYGRGPLSLSRLALAWQAGEGQAEDKFTRHGIRVVPLPTRTFRKGQNVFVYYEVYNLRPDVAGLTHHSVEYTIKTEGGGIISKMFPGFVGKRPEVAVSQTQTGVQEAEYRYIELDLSGLSPGQGTLTVTVKDLKSGEAVSRELAFTMAE